jgi:hypothetical protein
LYANGRYREGILTASMAEIGRMYASSLLQAMIDLIERRLDVKFNNPVVFPATLARHGCKPPVENIRPASAAFTASCRCRT